jgi:hypothetical protein
MIVNGSPRASKIEIDLAGPSGNAFNLLAVAARLSRQLRHSSEKEQAIQLEMTSGNYDNLIEAFDKHFGDYVILYKTF